MLRLSKALTKTKQINPAIVENKQFAVSCSFDYAHPLKQLIQSNSYLTVCNKYDFSRKKSKIDTKLDSELNKKIENQIKYKKKLWEKKFFQFSLMNMLPFLGFAIIFLFGKMHIDKKPQNSSQVNQNKKGNERKNVNMVPQLGMRQLIMKGDVMDLKLQIVRKNRSRGGQQYTTFCFLKRANGQPFAAEIPLLSQFLMFVESLPYEYRVSFQYEPHHQRQQSAILSQIINVGLIAGAFLIGRRLFKAFKDAMKNAGGQNMFDLDNKKIQAIKPENINTLFKDVAGMHEAKFQITQFVDFLKQPEKYIEMGAKVPKGALLTGPPGTGKTLLARACAGQAGVPFYYVSGSDFVQKYVGLGASRVRKLFDEAEKNAPSIIFIDEIDAIGKKRDSGPFANEERDNTLNQLLVRMDGFDSKNKVIVMAATNIKDTLDPALLRPGRFDRSVQIGLPNFQQRKQILQVHLKKVKFDSKFTIQELANRISILTPGFSGAQLANICNQAAILAARQGADSIDMPKFQKATQRVMAGLQKRNLFSDEQKLMLAYYECGKAVVGWFTEGSDPIIKLSILPFSKASKGYSHTIKDEIGLTTKEQLIGKVCFYLAGRAAEQHFKQYVTTNGDTDLKRAKRIISLLVTKFGMSEKLKHIAFPDIEFVRKPYSSVIEITIDEQIDRITKQCINKVQTLINQKSDLIEKLKVKLLEKQSLNHNDIKQILGERPFESNENYQKYVIEEQKAHQNVEAPVEGGQKLHENKMGNEEENNKNDNEPPINKSINMRQF